MENLLVGGVNELETVKSAINDLAQKEQTFKESDRSLKAREKELEIQKKRIEEKINSTVKRARADLDKEYDGQISSAERAIKDAEVKKKNAKAAAVNLRMKRENSSLVDENKILAAEISARFKEFGVPSICRNRIYYALFQPKNKMDIVYCLIGLVVCAFLIPFLITRAVSTPFLAAVVWVLIVVFFAAMYFLVLSWTKKGSRNEEIVKARPSIDRISENKKFIKKRNKNIKADPDESQYNLSEYDFQVDTAKKEYAEIKARKEEAVKNFEEVESISIRQKMENEYAATIDSLQHEIDMMKEDLTSKTESFQAAKAVVEEYKAVLGEKNIKVEKIDELISYFTEGKAGTVEQALEVQKNK